MKRKKKMKYYTVKEFAEKIGVHAQTVRNWDRKNILKPAFTSPTGYRMYSEQQVEDYFNGKFGINK